MNDIKLETAKDIAAEMIYFDMLEHEQYDGIFVYHPFFQTRYLADKEGIFDTKAEPMRFAKLQEGLERDIRNADNIAQILMRIESAWKIEYILELYKSDVFSDCDCGLFLRKIWAIIENNELQEEFVTDLMEEWLSAVPTRKLMSPKDYKYYKSLPEEVTVYRGTQQKFGEADVGFSWSTDYNVAKWFANRWNTADNGADNPVCRMTIRKSDIIFYTNEREEHEVVLLPSKIDISKIEIMEE